MTFLLVTPRLLLRELVPDDLDFVALLLADPMFMRFNPRLLTREEAMSWIDRQRERHARAGHGLWLAENGASGLPWAGWGSSCSEWMETCIRKSVTPSSKRWWKRGLATESARAVCDRAFEVRRCDRLASLIRPANSPSRRVAGRVGRRRWTACMHAGVPHDVYVIDRGPAS